MDKVSSWIISIIVAVIINLLIEILMPDGKLSKTIKSILAILIIVIIVSPLKSVDLSKLNITNLFGKIEINRQFVEEREKEKVASIESQIENNLTVNGYKNITVKIDGNYKDNLLKIKYIYVDLERLVITDEALNINKYSNIMGIIKSVVAIEEEYVIFYE